MARIVAAETSGTVRQLKYFRNYVIYYMTHVRFYPVQRTADQALDWRGKGTVNDEQMDLR